MITRQGRIKRVEVGAFESVRSSGLIAINLDEDDELGWVKATRGKQDLILVSEKGQSIRFSEEDVRAMGRTAAGVYAMRLEDDDQLTGADVVEPDCDLLLITEKGYGKRTPLREFRLQSRYGKGVRAMELSELTGRLVSARVVNQEDEVTCISVGGIILRTPVTTISRQGRYSRGVTVMDMKGNDMIASVAIIREGHLSRVNEDRSENGQARDSVAAVEEQSTPVVESPADPSSETPEVSNQGDIS
jgi:DNA gyrase subunit A